MESYFGFLKWICMTFINAVLGKERFVKFLTEFCFRLTKKSVRSRFTEYDYYSNDLCKLNLSISKKERDLEFRRDIQENETDSVLVFGANSQNDRFLARVSTNGQRLASSFFYLHLSDGKSYQSYQKSLHNVPKTSNDCFAGNELRIRCLLPMRKWKIKFNGLVRECDSDGKTRDIHAKLSFTWFALAHPHDLKTDIPSSSWADFLCEEKLWPWSSKAHKLNENMDNYVQSGNINGWVNIDGLGEREVLLWGSRKRSVEINDATIADSLEILASTKEGQAFHCGEIQGSDLKSKLYYGSVVLRTAWSSIMEFINISKNDNNPLQVKQVTLKNKMWSFKLNIKENFEELSYHTLNSKYETKVQFVSLELEDDIGQAVIIYHSCSNQVLGSLPDPLTSLPLLDGTSFCNDLVLDLEDTECQKTSLTGGKGSSLGNLTYLKSTVAPVYLVPKGVVVTTKAYEEFDDIARITEKSCEIERVAWSPNPLVKDIEDICEKTVAYISKSELSLKIRNSVVKKLKTVIGEDFSTKKFAIRSSASGEDSDELSAAGQMQTFLGVFGVENIMKSIVSCWASQFSITAVQYKRQNGQILNSPMAVVIQEMVPANVSGVMFTVDPVTDNPRYITITANYGIGESVVSATADPDTVIFEKLADFQLHLKSTEIGAKKIKTVMSGDSGITSEQVDEESTRKCCLEVNQAQALCEIALKVESAYGCPLDLEWSIYKGDIYLLQARPITTIERDVDYDILHETNSALRCENEFLTRANIGEVLNGAISMFGCTVLENFGKSSMFKSLAPRNKYMFNYDPFSEGIFSVHCYQGFLNMANFALRFYQKDVKSFVTESMMFAGFGRLMDDEEMLNLAENRNRFYPTSSALKAMYYMLTDILFAKGRTGRYSKKFEKEKVDLKHCRNAEEMLYSSFTQLSKFCEPNARHIECSGASTIINCIIMYTLFSGDWNVELFKDFSKVVKAGLEVESADIPAAIQELVDIITKCSNDDDFKNKNGNEISQWLEDKNSEPGKHFIKFLKKHGHRCINEIDIYSKPWRINQTELIEIIKNTERSGGILRAKTMNSVSETIETLSVPLTWKSKLLLRLLIPMCHRAVQARELSKSLSVRYVDAIRKPMAILAKKMVQEGRLPDEELFFFFHFFEVEEYLKTRSPKILQKAIKRRVMFPKASKLRYPEITKGLPKPVNKTVHPTSDIDSSFSFHGTPVSSGVVKGPARVAIELKDAKLIQPGDILIAYSTDIGWSPYFPMLAGIATELGGLVSHGAVVAREYGLPCIVGVHGATETFKSGDIVLLNGNKGILQMASNSQ